VKTRPRRPIRRPRRPARPSRRPRRPRRGRAGFTLVELMVVIAIIGLLAAVVTVNVMGQTYKARLARVKADMDGIKNALKLYKVDTGLYPQQLGGLWENPGGAPSWGPEPYLEPETTPPLDPWGHEYVYQFNGSDYEIISYGADGAPGGQDEAVDLSSKTINQAGERA